MPKTVFNPFDTSEEQNILDDLINEAIDIHSPFVYYLPRTISTYEEIFYESEVSQFNSAYQTNMYFKSAESYGGDGRFLGKFGLEVRDQINLQAGITRFNEDVVATSNNEVDRPREGDIVYVPMIGKAFTIMYVTPNDVFYQLGKLQIYDLTCELFEYSNEIFNTGIQEIDSYNELRFSANTSQDAQTVFDESDTHLTQNDDFENLADEIQDFSIHNPFGEY